MNRKLLAGVAALGLLAGGGGAAALAVAMPAAATSTATSVTATVPAYGPLGSLVAKGTITQAQATAIRDGLIRYMRAHWQDMRRDCTGAGADRTPWMLEHGGALDTVLSQLVKGHTLTRSQASAVTGAYTQWMNSHHRSSQPGYGHRGGMMGGTANWRMGGSGNPMM